MDWNDWFVYDDSSDSCLRWKVDRYAGGRKLVSAGDSAGTIGGQEYYRVQLAGKLYTVHRIIWELAEGVIPDEMEIDHRDQNKRNNRLENLRLVTSSVNARNRKLRSDSKTGSNGVNRRERVLPSGSAFVSWIARFVDAHGIRRSKEFSEAKFGPEGAAKLALDFINRNRVAADGYSALHGKEVALPENSC